MSAELLALPKPVWRVNLLVEIHDSLSANTAQEAMDYAKHMWMSTGNPKVIRVIPTTVMNEIDAQKFDAETAEIIKNGSVSDNLRSEVYAND
jgi:acetylornithine/succinyldiaminopimelate/putrescine aminotransferase